jgi:hypothetical protein
MIWQSACSLVVAASARRLVAAVALLLPRTDRRRFYGECCTRLWDLPPAGAGRCQQLQHATHQLRSSTPLRIAVLAPRSGKASP